MTRRKVNRREYEEWNGRAWNAFVDLIATDDPNCLTDIQLRAHLIFWYDAEVSNGGHLQYFVNRGVEPVIPTLQAMKDVEMHCHLKVLAGAFEFIRLNPINKIETAEEYVAEALEDRLGQFDAEFYKCEQEPPIILESYLAMHFEEFIELTDEDGDKLSIDPDPQLPLTNSL